MVVLHTEPNEAPITELFAFLSVDDTGEGICASILPELGSTPLVTSKQRNARKMIELARDIARQTGKTVRLVRFTRAEVMWFSETI